MNVEKYHIQFYPNSYYLDTHYKIKVDISGSINIKYMDQIMGILHNHYYHLNA